MSYYLIGHPQLTDTDLNWIQSIRKDHDPNFNLIGPHFTLVFEIPSTKKSELVDHARSILSETPRIDFVCRSAIFIPSIFEGGWYTFLVPDEGFSEITKLHDRLYHSPLSQYLRMDIPFVPHMTIGRLDDARKCKELVDRVNNQNPSIRGTITHVDLLEIEGDNIDTILEIPFAGRSNKDLFSRSK